MSTRDRTRRPAETEFDPLMREDVTDEDVELYLEEQEEQEHAATAKKPGFLNIQTGSGLALIGIGMAYLLQQLGILPFGFDFTGFIQTLPWLAGILIILTGFGVMGWSPAKRREARRRAARARQAERARAAGRTMGRAAAEAAARDRAQAALRQAESAGSRAFDQARRLGEQAWAGARSGEPRTRRLAKSRRERKIAGVCAGLARYFGLEPTVVRILFVIGTIFGQGAGLVLYLILAFALPKADADEEPPNDPFIRVVRD